MQISDFKKQWRTSGYFARAKRSDPIWTTCLGFPVHAWTHWRSKVKLFFEPINVKTISKNLTAQRKWEKHEIEVDQSRESGIQNVVKLCIADWIESILVGCLMMDNGVLKRYSAMKGVFIGRKSGSMKSFQYSITSHCRVNKIWSDVLAVVFLSLFYSQRKDCHSNVRVCSFGRST